MTAADPPALPDSIAELARLHGIQREWRHASGKLRHVAADTVCALLDALGSPASTAAEAEDSLARLHRERAAELLPPVVTAWNGQPGPWSLRLSAGVPATSIRCELLREDGTRQSWTLAAGELPPLAGDVTTRQLVLPVEGPLPPGRHQLEIEHGSRRASAWILSAPSTAWPPQHGSRSPGSPPEQEPHSANGFEMSSAMWGLFLPLYSLVDKDSWGAGNFSNLADLAEWCGGQGGSIVGTLPLLAASLDEPCDPSPYAPLSRLFWNEFHLDIPRCPEFARSEAARALVSSSRFQHDLHTARHTDLIDWKQQMRLRRQVLELLAEEFFAAPTADRQRQFENYVARRPEVRDYAAFRAAGEQLGANWQQWPAEFRGGTLPEDFGDPAARRFWQYAQWQADEQMAAAAGRAEAEHCGLYLDLPLGCRQDGYDLWRHQSAWAVGTHVGAPPDPVFTRGQDWGFAPLHPQRIRQQGFRHLLDVIEHHLTHSRILRIDHVMSLHRLWWIPPGFPAAHGAYIGYPAEELTAALCLMSHRHQALIVGENLGTVPPEVNKSLRQHGIRTMHVLQYEFEGGAEHALQSPPADVLASLNTHDMPPLAAWWAGEDIDDRLDLELLTPEQAEKERQRRAAQLADLIHTLRERGWSDAAPASEGVEPQSSSGHRAGDAPADGLPAPETTDVRGPLRFLAASPAETVLINIEDLWRETRTQNFPGTSSERPNWLRRAARTFEEFRDDPEIRDLLAELNQLRHGNNRHSGVRRTVGMNRPRGKSSPSETAASEPEPAVPASSGSAVQSSTLLSEEDLYLFNEGTHRRLYNCLGAHLLERDGVTGTHFAVWAPDAELVTVIGDFNGWETGKHPLAPRGSSGIWEGFIPGVAAGTRYKYHIRSRVNGYKVNKADPFGVLHEIPPQTASVVWNGSYDWNDSDWMQTRGGRNALTAPLSIYEVHPGSWQRKAEDGNRSLTWRELAHALTPYVQEHGFTHVELMPVMEHPFFGSWGYQITGYFAPTSRMGSPEDFRYLVDYLHQHDIGVILDWVPSHFPNDEHGLNYFDGSHLYEHADPRQGFHPDWSSCIFNYGRNEVRSFLLSNALYWLSEFHIDGLRVDAVASMLYLDYSRKDGEWIPNRYGGRENLEAISLLRMLNEAIYEEHPDVQTFAEESTAWPMVSRPVEVGGLGFGLKWDMGWMHDTLRYFSHDPVHRKYHHGELTFRMIYAFNENFVLPLSHDEVVHGKGSLLDRMPGDDWQKFAGLRLLYGYMFGMPGKKMLFMGGEFGQWSEWQHDGTPQWELADYDRHKGVSRWMKSLNRVYREEPALHARDCTPDGFEWIDANDWANSVLSFLRIGGEPESSVAVVCNFTPVVRHNYRIGVPTGGFWREILNSDAEEHGGSGQGNLGGVQAVEVACHGRPYSLNLTLPPMGVIFLKQEGDVE